MINEKLRQLLDDAQKLGDIYYGMHSSSHAMFTCLVFSYDKNHIHFLDGANGGYTQASKAMKTQMRS